MAVVVILLAVCVVVLPVDQEPKTFIGLVPNPMVDEMRIAIALVLTLACVNVYITSPV